MFVVYRCISSTQINPMVTRQTIRSSLFICVLFYCCFFTTYKRSYLGCENTSMAANNKQPFYSSFFSSVFSMSNLSEILAYICLVWVWSPSMFFEFCREKSSKESLVYELCIVRLILSSQEELMLCYFHIVLSWM